MSLKLNPKTDPAQPVVYQIRLQGELDSQWTDWFGGLTITLDAGGDTLLTGPVVDQAALHGLLKQVRDLGLPLVSVSRVQPDANHPIDARKEQDMLTNAGTTRPDETKIDVRLKLSALWIALMLLYIYADIISFHRPGVIEDIVAGRMGPFAVTQASLLTAAILMIIPAGMVFLCLSLNHTAARWTNIILGVVYTLVNIANLLGEPWAFYILFGSLELALTLLIAWKACKWRRPADQT